MNNKIYMSDAFPVMLINEYGNQIRPRGNQKTKKRRIYKNVICAFDIETSVIPDLDQSIMYIWQMQIEEYTIIGRTWDEFKRFMLRLSAALKPGEYLVIYVFNLPYEWQFLAGIYPFKSSEVFATESRKVLRCDMYDHFEFRCAYRLTNMSLDEFLKSMNVEHLKQDGESFDYSAFRTPSTMLTASQMQYCVNDVLGLVEALKKKMELDGDNLYSIPSTSTGYIRRIVKKRMRGFPRDWLDDMLPDMPRYLLLKDCFRGGNTHGSRYYVADIQTNVHSYDRSSSYPDVIVNCRYPMGKFRKEAETVERLTWLLNHDRAVIMRFRLYDVRLHNVDYPVPYLASAKCQVLEGQHCFNGRVLTAKLVETAMCDIDFRILLDQYDFSDIEIVEMYSARYGALPDAIVKTVLEYYGKKTLLKGTTREYEYSCAKALLNAIYGMMVQSPVRPVISYEGGEFIEDDSNPEGELEKHNHSAFEAYQWGVYVSAWARERLERAIRLIYETPGAEFMYTDTDSVKYTGTVDWTALNDKLRNDSISHKGYANDRKGVTHYLGVYEYEGTYDRFRQYGAKKYAYEEDGKLHITIAGVNKKKGAEELAEKGGLDALTENFLFVKGGGTDLIYNDDPEVKEYVTASGEKLKITRNVVIKDSTYQMGLTGEFRRIMMHPEAWRQATEDFR